MNLETGMPFDPEDPEQLGQFQKAAAGIMRDILSAIDQLDPRFLKPEVRQQWWSGANKRSRLPVKRLLRNAATNLQRLPDRFGGAMNSLPFSDDVVAPSPAESCEELVNLVLTFSDMRRLASAEFLHQQGKKIDLEKLCDWGSLGRIRKILNELKDPSSSPHKTRRSEWKGLSAIPPGEIHFQGKRIETTHPKIWKAINLLLKKSTHEFDVVDFYNRLWEKELSANENEGSTIWGPVHSFLREVRKFLKKDHLPFTVRGLSREQKVRLKEHNWKAGGRNQK